MCWASILVRSSIPARPNELVQLSVVRAGTIVDCCVPSSGYRPGKSSNSGGIRNYFYCQTRMGKYFRRGIVILRIFLTPEPMVHEILVWQKGGSGHSLVDWPIFQRDQRARLCLTHSVVVYRSCRQTDHLSLLYTYVLRYAPALGVLRLLQLLPYAVQTCDLWHDLCPCACPWLGVMLLLSMHDPRENRWSVLR
jgi:hypothetical protein